ncbi:MAG: Uncharacterized protein G01um101493_324 [Microgenomates group bacterium Gr01-1014_93]|nr:MAG: Uncharacterized protein G01um101493_324 [Microgenomates group bacterium Gr01-1014_93]
MISAYLENPKNHVFQGQDPDEKILLLLRAHIITNLSWIIPAIFIFLIPFFLPQAAAFLGFDLFSLPQTYLTAFLVINYLLVLIISFEGFLYWYFNVNIITNKRIVDIDFYSILFKNIDFAPLSDIQQASSSIAGVLGLIFNFGNVGVQTAGATIEVDFKNIPNPDKVADFISDLSEK